MKFSELPTTDHNGRPLEGVQNGVVRRVQLGNDEHGSLTAWLFIEGDGWGCGFGNLERPGYVAEFIARSIRVVLGTPYGNWEDLAGKPVRVLSEGLGGGIVAVGNYLKDEWFCPWVELDGGEKCKTPRTGPWLSKQIESILREIGVVGPVPGVGDPIRWSVNDLATDLGYLLCPLLGIK